MKKLLLTLGHRLVLFLVFQSLVALTLFLIGYNNPWIKSQEWWFVSGFLTNLFTLYLLIVFFKKGRSKFFDIFKFIKHERGKNILIALGILLISVPLSQIPNFALGNALLGSVENAGAMLLNPIPSNIVFIGVLWALTQGLVELPIYFIYVMPRLEKKTNGFTTAWIITTFFLAIQHITLPLIFDFNFIIWRFGSFILFALFLGYCLKKRPQLLPYLAIMHTLMDLIVVFQAASA